MADPRSSSAKMIAERLRAEAMPLSSAHPDADLLTAFAERSLSERERTRVMEHLAHCAVCRDVVYLAQPEVEAPSPQASGSVVPIRWFAWRRLQWAALAASLSLVVALTVLVRENSWENPKKSVLVGSTSEPASPPAAAPAATKGDTASSAYLTYSNDSPSAAQSERAQRRESAFASPEKQGKLKAEAKAGDGSGRFAFHGAETHDYFANASPDLARSAPDDLQKKLNPFDKEAPARGSAYTFGTEKDTATGANVTSYSGTTADGAANSNGTLFDLNQRAANVGPAANMNGQNNFQNYTTNGLYRDRLDEISAAKTAANQPAPPPPATAPVAAAGDLKQSAQAAPPEQGRAAGGPVEALQRRAAPTRAVVPAEEARNKKPETIPAHATPQATEETVAVVGKAQDADSAHAAASGTIAEREIHELPLSGRDASLVALSPGVPPTGAITGWRVHHGKLLGKLYGIWHDLILRKLQTVGENSVTEISSAFESSAGLKAKTQTGAANEKVSAVSGGVVVAQQHFASVTSLGSDVWALEIVSPAPSQLVVHHSRDAGITWQPSTLTAPETLKPNTEAGIKFKDAQQGEITLPTGEKWQTADGGAHWSYVK